jgi:hypothetical protein
MTPSHHQILRTPRSNFFSSLNRICAKQHVSWLLVLFNLLDRIGLGREPTSAGGVSCVVKVGTAHKQQRELCTLSVMDNEKGPTRYFISHVSLLGTEALFVSSVRSTFDLHALWIVLVRGAWYDFRACDRKSFGSIPRSHVCNCFAGVLQMFFRCPAVPPPPNVSVVVYRDFVCLFIFHPLPK